MTNKPHSFKHHQAVFTAYVKDPDHAPIPTGVKPERMAIYAELILNNLENFLSSNFPVLKKITSDEAWSALVRAFLIEHPSKTPYFCEIPQEFLTYLQNERTNSDDLPFLLELAHYEWVEMALSIDQAELVINSPLENILTQRLTLSPLTWLLAYEYPVHTISPTYIPTEPPTNPTFLVVYRALNDDIKFIAINLMTYRLLSLIDAQPGQLTTDYLHQIEAEMPQYPTEVITTGALQILQEFAEKHLITLLVNT